MSEVVEQEQPKPEVVEYNIVEDFDQLRRTYPRCTEWCKMKLVWWEDPKYRPGVMATRDKLFCGTSSEHLQANVNYYIMKHGIIQAYAYSPEAMHREYGDYANTEIENESDSQVSQSGS